MQGGWMCTQSPMLKEDPWHVLHELHVPFAQSTEHLCSTHHLCPLISHADQVMCHSAEQKTCHLSYRKILIQKKKKITKKLN